MSDPASRVTADPARRRPGILVWAVLIAATAVSWSLGAHHQVFGAGPRWATVGVLVIAFGKVQLVGRHFMELRRAPRVLSWLFTGWVVAVCAVLVGLYLRG